MAKTTQNYGWTVPEASDPADVTVLSDAIESVDETIKGFMDGLKTQMLEAIYPVGSIYTSVKKVSPASFLGGTWEMLQETFLYATADEADTGATATAGAASHTHTTAGHTLTVAEMPSHTHTQEAHAHKLHMWSDAAATGSKVNAPASTSPLSSVTFTDSLAPKIKNTGGGAEHSHGDTGESSSMPPYMKVYMWKRTA
ncbi:MAG: hypothetical protein PUC26_05675 [Eubacteriales bacterium]|nr:hypothetical protein [Eubacteriales bacterium]